MNSKSTSADHSCRFSHMTVAPLGGFEVVAVIWIPTAVCARVAISSGTPTGTNTQSDAESSTVVDESPDGPSQSIEPSKAVADPPVSNTRAALLAAID